MRLLTTLLTALILCLAMPSMASEKAQNKGPTLEELRQELLSRPPVIIDNSKKRETFKLGTEVIKQKGTHGIRMPFLFSKKVLFGNSTTGDNEKKDFYAENYSPYEYSVSQGGGGSFGFEFALID